MSSVDDAITLTREELYEQVWSEPMWTLAPRYGLSDVGLAKTCRRHKIPVPWRGSWQQKQAGQQVRAAPLPKLPASLAAALATITLRSPTARRPGGDGTTQRIDAPPSIAVAEILVDPHPLVAHTIKALRRVKPTKDGLLPRSAAADYLDVRVTLGTVDRAMRILDALLKAMDERGYSISIDIRDQRAITRAHLLDEVIPFHLEERIDLVPVPPPPPKRPGDWVPRPTSQAVASGALEFYIDADWPLASREVRRSWRDGKQQRVEDCLGKILVGFAAAAQALREDRLEREERQRRWQEQERRRRHARWEERQEKRRREALQEELERWRLCLDLREYVAMRRARGAPAGGDVERWEAWLDWITRYAERVEERLASCAGPDPEPFDENAYYY